VTPRTALAAVSLAACATESPPVPAEGLCAVEVRCPDPVLAAPATPCTLTVTDEAGGLAYDGPAGVALRDGSTGWFDKPAYALELRDAGALPIRPGDTWSYLDDGSDAGTAWREPAYDDRAWAWGPSPLGFGDPHLPTVVAHDPAGPSLTTYLRTTFPAPTDAAGSRLALGLLRDDGAAVYLNGVEVLRDNLPADAGFDEPALVEASDREGSTWSDIDLDPSLLRDGTNLLAVEVHLARPESTSLRFDLSLAAVGAAREVDLLGMGAAARWSLDGRVLDPSRLRSRFAKELYGSFGGAERFAPQTRFCELVLDGSYEGIYTLGEELEVGEGRLRLAGGPGLADAFLVTRGADDGGFLSSGIGPGSWTLVDPAPSPEREAAVAAYLLAFERAVSTAGPAPEGADLFAWVDLGSAVDWVLLRELTAAPDGHGAPIHLWRSDAGPLHFAPWDFDASLGAAPDASPVGWVPRDELVERMAATPAFRVALQARWRALRRSELSTSALDVRLAALDATLAPARAGDLARWPPAPAAGAPAADFLRGRLAWMDANLARF
jgi:hypothetical protein